MSITLSTIHTYDHIPTDIQAHIYIHTYTQTHTQTNTHTLTSGKLIKMISKQKLLEKISLCVEHLNKY